MKIFISFLMEIPTFSDYVVILVLIKSMHFSNSFGALGLQKLVIFRSNLALKSTGRYNTLPALRSSKLEPEICIFLIKKRLLAVSSG